MQQPSGENGAPDASPSTQPTAPAPPPVQRRLPLSRSTSQAAYQRPLPGAMRPPPSAPTRGRGRTMPRPQARRPLATSVDSALAAPAARGPSTVGRPPEKPLPQAPRRGGAGRGGVGQHARSMRQGSLPRPQKPLPRPGAPPRPPQSTGVFGDAPEATMQRPALLRTQSEMPVPRKPLPKAPGAAQPTTDRQSSVTRITRDTLTQSCPSVVAAAHSPSEAEGYYVNQRLLKSKDVTALLETFGPMPPGHYW